MRTKLAIIILNYRTPDLTMACVDSLRGEMQPGVRVVVVDNASPDGSADRIQDHISRSGYEDWAQVLRSPVNGGFASGNNLGIRGVAADAYILLNSDTTVRPGAIAELGRALEQNPRAGMIGPSFEGPDGETQQSCFRFHSPISEFLRAANTGPLTKLLRKHDVPLPFSDAPLEPDWIGFACVVIRREVIDQVGLLDEGFFMYFEDVDFCRKVRAAGWTILYWPKPRIMHLMGGSSQISSSDATRRRPSRYFYEARARYFATHFGVAGLLAANTLWTVGRAVSFSREVVERKPSQVKNGEVRDIWINMLNPMRPSSMTPPAGGAAPTAAEAGAQAGVDESGDGDPAGSVNANPSGIGLLDLIREDFATHQRDPLSPGFWAVVVHRFGNWRLGVKPPLARAPLDLVHKTMSTAVDWLWGINLGADVKVGRRVWLSHHGSMILGARSIGDDVHVQQNTTFGDPGRKPTGRRPIIEARVDVGVGVSILGDVTIGHDTVVGPNAVVLASCPPHSKLDGVPARVSQKPTPTSAPTPATGTQVTLGATPEV